MLEIFFIILKLICSLIIILALIYLSYKLSNDKLSKYTQSKYIKILERTQISKDAYILVVKAGEKGYILSVTNNNVEKLNELTKDEVLSLEKSKEKEIELVNNKFNRILDKVKIFNKENK